MTDTVTDGAGTRYEARTATTLFLADRYEYRTSVRVFTHPDEGQQLLVGAGDRVYVEPAEYIRQVAKLAGLEVTIGETEPVAAKRFLVAEPEPEAEEPDRFFPVVPNLSAVEVTEGLVARGNLPYGVQPCYDDRTGRLLGVQMRRAGDGRLEVVSLGDYLVGGGGEPVRPVDRHLFDTFYRRVGA